MEAQTVSFKESITNKGNEHIKVYHLETYLEEGKILFLSIDKKVEINICNEIKKIPFDTNFQIGFYTIWWKVNKNQFCKIEITFLEDSNNVKLNPVYYDYEAKIIASLITKDSILFLFIGFFLILFLFSNIVFVFRKNNKTFLYLSLFLLNITIYFISIANESLSYFIAKINPIIWKNSFYVSLYLIPILLLLFLQPFLFNKKSLRYKISFYSLISFFIFSSILCLFDFLRWEKTISTFHFISFLLPFILSKEIIKSVKHKKNKSFVIGIGLLIFIITSYIDIFISRIQHNMYHSIFYLGVLSLLISMSIILWKRYLELERKILVLNTLKKTKSKTKMSQVRLAGLDTHNLKLQLKLLFEDEKIYKNDSLNLVQLSNQLKIRQDQLSCLINVEFQKSFQAFINDFRIEEAKKLLTSFKEYSVIRIAYDVGFNSKSSFNEEFKKRTGISPTQYRKKTS